MAKTYQFKKNDNVFDIESLENIYSDSHYFPKTNTLKVYYLCNLNENGKDGKDIDFKNVTLKNGEKLSDFIADRIKARNPLLRPKWNNLHPEFIDLYKPGNLSDYMRFWGVTPNFISAMGYMNSKGKIHPMTVEDTTRAGDFLYNAMSKTKWVSKDTYNNALWDDNENNDESYDVNQNMATPYYTVKTTDPWYYCDGNPKNNSPKNRKSDTYGITMGYNSTNYDLTMIALWFKDIINDKYMRWYLNHLADPNHNKKIFSKEKWIDPETIKKTIKKEGTFTKKKNKKKYKYIKSNMGTLSANQYNYIEKFASKFSSDSEINQILLPKRLRHNNNVLFSDDYKRNMTSLLRNKNKNAEKYSNSADVAWCIHKGWTQSNRYLDISELNEHQKKVPLKRLSGVDGLQILESRYLSATTDKLTNYNQLADLIAYNNSDVQNTMKLFELPVYQDALSLRRILLDRYPQLIYNYGYDKVVKNHNGATLQNTKLDSKVIKSDKDYAEDKEAIDKNKKIINEYKHGKYDNKIIQPKWVKRNSTNIINKKSNRRIANIADYPDVEERPDNLRYTRLDNDSSSQKFIANTIAPYHQMKDLPCISYMYPDERVLHDNQINRKKAWKKAEKSGNKQQAEDAKEIYEKTPRSPVNILNKTIWWANQKDLKYNTPLVNDNGEPLEDKAGNWIYQERLTRDKWTDDIDKLKDNGWYNDNGKDNRNFDRFIVKGWTKSEVVSNDNGNPIGIRGQFYSADPHTGKHINNINELSAKNVSNYELRQADNSNNNHEQHVPLHSIINSLYEPYLFYHTLEGLNVNKNNNEDTQHESLKKIMPDVNGVDRPVSKFINITNLVHKFNLNRFYINSNGTNSTCLAVFSVGGIHGAEIKLESYLKRLKKYQHKIKLLNIVKSYYLNKNLDDIQIKPEHRYLKSGAQRTIKYSKSDNKRLDSIKNASKDVQKSFKAAKAAVRVTRGHTDKIPDKLAQQYGLKKGFEFDPHNYVKGTHKDPSWRSFKRDKPSLFQHPKNGNWTLRNKYDYVSVAPCQHEDFSGYYPLLLSKLGVFWPRDHKKDVYKEIYHQRLALKAKLKNYTKNSPKWNVINQEQLLRKLLLNSASGAGDAKFYNNIKKNNAVTSMRILGQLFAWRIGEGETLADGYRAPGSKEHPEKFINQGFPRVPSTNTDGMYVMDVPPKINNKILFDEVASMMLDIGPVPLIRFVSKDANNRLEVENHGTKDDPKPTLAEAKGGTLTSWMGPGVQNSLSHPAILDYVLAKYLAHSDIIDTDTGEIVPDIDNNIAKKSIKSPCDRPFDYDKALGYMKNILARIKNGLELREKSRNNNDTDGYNKANDMIVSGLKYFQWIMVSSPGKHRYPYITNYKYDTSKKIWKPIMESNNNDDSSNNRDIPYTEYVYNDKKNTMDVIPKDIKNSNMHISIQAMPHTSRLFLIKNNPNKSQFLKMATRSKVNKRTMAKRTKKCRQGSGFTGNNVQSKVNICRLSEHIDPSVTAIFKDNGDSNCMPKEPDIDSSYDAKPARIPDMPETQNVVLLNQQLDTLSDDEVNKLYQNLDLSTYMALARKKFVHAWSNLVEK